MLLPNAHRKDAVYKIVLTIVMANAKSRKKILTFGVKPGGL